MKKPGEKYGVFLIEDLCELFFRINLSAHHYILAKKARAKPSHKKNIHTEI